MPHSARPQIFSHNPFIHSKLAPPGWLLHYQVHLWREMKPLPSLDYSFCGLTLRNMSEDFKDSLMLAP